MIHSCLWLRLFPPPLGAPAAPHKDSIEEHGQYCKAQGLMYLIISPSVLRFTHVCIEFERFFRLFGWSKVRKTQTKNYAHTHTHHLLEEPKQTLNKKKQPILPYPTAVLALQKKTEALPPKPTKKNTHNVTNTTKQHVPADSIRDLFIPDRWRSPKRHWKGSSFHSPSQKKVNHQFLCDLFCDGEFTWPFFKGWKGDL